MFDPESINIIAAVAAPAGADKTIAEVISFQVVGFTIVMLVLATVWLAIEIMGRIFKRFPNLALSLTEPARPKRQMAQAPEEGGTLTPERVAVLAAALHTVIKGPHRIVSIKESRSGPDQKS